MRDTNDLLWEEYDMEYQPYKYREMNIERMIGLLKTRGFFFETEFENLPNLGIEKCSHELVDVLKAKSLDIGDVPFLSRFMKICYN